MNRIESNHRRLLMTREERQSAREVRAIVEVEVPILKCAGLA